MAKRKTNKGTDFGEIAERIEAKLDFDKIKSKEEYKQKIKQLVLGDTRGENLLKKPSTLENVFEEGEFKKVLEKREEETLTALQQAQKIERGRPLRSRIRDESRTSRRSLPATRRNIKRWKKNFGKMDINKVDTKLPRARRGNDSQMLTKEDLKLPKGYKTTVNSLGVRQYRSGNGQFLSAKKLRKLRSRRWLDNE